MNPSDLKVLILDSADHEQKGEVKEWLEEYGLDVETGGIDDGSYDAVVLGTPCYCDEGAEEHLRKIRSKLRDAGIVIASSRDGPEDAELVGKGGDSFVLKRAWNKTRVLAAVLRAIRNRTLLNSMRQRLNGEYQQGDSQGLAGRSELDNQTE